MLDRSFWNGRRVFLTGHTGFKGSWLSLWLDSLGANVTGYSLEPPTTPSLYEQASVASVGRSIAGDIRDFPRLKAALEESRPEVVLHMAAQSVVRRGYEDPIETYSSNVMGTVNLFEAIREIGQPCAIINVTSDKCYENREWSWGYRESERLGGRDPYSNSKACAELVTSAYRESFFSTSTISAHGVAIASARAGNAIGGGDWTSNQLIPDLIRAFLAGRRCVIRNPSAIRPWQFVLEPLRGYLMLAERLASSDGAAFSSGWNFGPADSDAKPVAWIADTLAASWGGGRWVLESGAQPHEAHLLKLDASRARASLGWQPLLPLERALDWIVEWYRAYAAGADLQRITRRQIAAYEALEPGPGRSILATETIA